MATTIKINNDMDEIVVASLDEELVSLFVSDTNTEIEVELTDKERVQLIGALQAPTP